MAYMFVTRDVSQLSGWLKAAAYCRGSQAGHTVRGAGCGPQHRRRNAASDCGARAACRREGATTDLGGGGGEQRTENMPYMFVTPEASQLSGWLKAIANCRGSQAGHTVRGAGCGPQEARNAASDCGARAACRREGATTDLGGAGAGSSALKTCSTCL